MTVLVLSNPAAKHLKALARLPESTHIVVGDRLEAFREAAPRADVIFYGGGNKELLLAVWRLAKKVRWMHYVFAGLDGSLFPELLESPVPLTNARGVFKESLAEWALGAMLFYAKDIRRLIRSQEAGRWDQFDVLELYKQTAGIVGYGEIGKATARRAHALGMRVLAMRRKAAEPDEFVQEFFPRERLQDMMRQCDYVVASAPLTPDTRGMIGEAELAAMKPGAVIINIGRGPVIQEPALIQALEENRIRAALDVFDQEPLPEGHAFYRLSNVLLSPHCADHTPDWLDEAMDLFIRNFERFQNGLPLLNVVDKKAGY